MPYTVILLFFFHFLLGVQYSNIKVFKFIILFIYFSFYLFMGFSASSLPSVVGAGDVRSAVGSGSLGFLAASPSGFVGLPTVFFFCFPSSSCFFCCYSSFFVSFCFFSFPSGVFSAPFVAFLASFFFLSPLSCHPFCCSDHLFSFFVASCVLLLLSFSSSVSYRFFSAFRFFPLALLSSVLACRLQPSLRLFFRSSILLLLFVFGVSSSTFSGSHCVFSGLIYSSFVFCRPCCRFCHLASSCIFCVICCLFSAYNSSFLD